ncbi:MAG TPA: SHOCT domain-containing protein [Burkholderiaceae bacterium]|nr:SHOCT domain-containing protein [Burkholderiaceae bacterium]
MGWGGWGGGMFGLGHLLWWASLIVGVAVLVRWLVASGRIDGRRTEGRAMEILKVRYARGEIDKAEFEARKRDVA